MVEQTQAPIYFGILLGLAYQSFTDLLRASLAQQGFDDLGGAYGYVFRALADDEPSQRELAGRLGITDQGMAKILAEMVERRYVERHPDPKDSRVKRLGLGARGRAALAAARSSTGRLPPTAPPPAARSASAPPTSTRSATATSRTRPSTCAGRANRSRCSGARSSATGW